MGPIVAVASVVADSIDYAFDFEVCAVPHFLERTALHSSQKRLILRQRRNIMSRTDG